MGDKNVLSPVLSVPSVSEVSTDDIEMFFDIGEKPITVTEKTETKKSGSVYVTKRNGKKELLNVYKIQKRLESLISMEDDDVLLSSDQVEIIDSSTTLSSSQESTGVSLSTSTLGQSSEISNKNQKTSGKKKSPGREHLKLNVDICDLVTKVILKITDGIHTSQIDKIAITLALSKVQEEPDWDIFAARLYTSNEYKKLRNFTWTERCSMMYHGTWPYIFEEFDVKKEIGMKFSDNTEDEARKSSLGDTNRAIAVEKLKSISKCLEKLYSIGDENKGNYQRNFDGPYLYELNIKCDTGENGAVLPVEEWDFLKSTASKYLDTDEFQRLFVNKCRPHEVKENIIHRQKIIQQCGGLIEYEKKLRTQVLAFDKSGRIVRLHKILDFDFYSLTARKSVQLESIIDYIKKNIYMTMNKANSSYLATIGKFDYCLKTPLTKRYLELPHETIVRCACQATLANYYEDPRYARYIDTKKPTPFLAEEYYKSHSQKLKHEGVISDLSNKVYINFDLFDDLEWDKCIKTIKVYAMLLLNDIIALPTPTVKNSGTNNNQGTSCFLLHMKSDSLPGIYHTFTKKEISSGGGGGTSVKITSLRGSESIIKRKNGTSAGLTPVCGVMAVTTDHINQAGNRTGVNSPQMDWWHKDVPDVLQHKEASQKDRHGGEGEKNKSKNIFYAVLWNKTFMKRVAQNKNITLFCPSDVPLLNYAPDPATFDTIYCLYEEVFGGVNAKTINARQYFKNIADICLASGDPYMIAIDNANLLSVQVPRDNFGEIMTYEAMFGKDDPAYDEEYAKMYDRFVFVRQLNLCVEVGQPTAPDAAGGKIPDYHSVCNLSTVNVKKASVDQPTKGVIYLRGFQIIKSMIQYEVAYEMKRFIQKIRSYNIEFNEKAVDEEVSNTLKNYIDTIFSIPDSLNYKLELGNLSNMYQKEEMKRLCSEEGELKSGYSQYLENVLKEIPDNRATGNYKIIDLIDHDKVRHFSHTYLSKINALFTSSEKTDNKITCPETTYNVISKITLVQPIKNYMSNSDGPWLRALFSHLTCLHATILSYVESKSKILIAEEYARIKRKLDLTDKSLKVNSMLPHKDTSVNSNKTINETQNVEPTVDNIVDFSVLFAQGWFALRIANSFVSLNKNLPTFMQKYNQEYRSVIVGPSGVADTRIQCGISYLDLEKSLKLERDIQESMQFGCIMASNFLSTVIHKRAYPRFQEGCYAKGFFHHELYTKNFGHFINRDDFSKMEKSRNNLLCKLNTEPQDYDSTQDTGNTYTKNNRNFFIYKSPVYGSSDSEYSELIQKVIEYSSKSTEELTQDGHFFMTQGYLINRLANLVTLKRPNYFEGYFKGLYENYEEVLEQRTEYNLDKSENSSLQKKKEIIMKVESGMWSWENIRGLVMAYGLFNSTTTGAMPTSNSAIKIGGTPSFQPIQGIYVVKSGQHGNIVECSWAAINYLKSKKLWNNEIKRYIAINQGSIRGCPGVPENVQNVLLTAYEINPYVLIFHDAVRLAFNCQSMSSSRYLPVSYNTPEKYTQLLYYAYKLGIISLSYYTFVMSDVKGNTTSTLANNHVDVEVKEKKDVVQKDKTPQASEGKKDSKLAIKLPKKFAFNTPTKSELNKDKKMVNHNLSDKEKESLKELNMNIEEKNVIFSDVSVVSKSKQIKLNVCSLPTGDCCST